ncbi:MAG: glycoside hydrolase family 3 protein [Oscillospiraceae bacterium]|nr:glycoside hydrolase family 3 protein [Oscillospiraceae bacterium]
MAKRFLISALLVVLVIVGIIVGSSLIFTNRFEVLQEEQAEAEAQLSSTTADPDSWSASVSPEEDTVPSASDVVAAPTPQVSAAPAASTDEAALRAKGMLSSMTLQEKICQMLFVTPEALTGYSTVTQTGTTTMNAYSKWPVGGIVYFSQNLRSTDQTTQMIATLQSYAQETTGRGLFIGVDEEGGSVARAADSLGTTAFDDMADYGAAGDTQAVYDIGATQAAELTALGFNVNFSPVADVLTNSSNTVVAQRSFGSDPQLVSDMVTQVVKGLTDGGMLCAPKHFPGHGSTGGDTHNGFTSSERTLDELEACDLLPFQAAIDAGAPMIMVGHMTMVNIDEDNPASLSGTIVTGILRDQLNYDGIIITDAMNMGAIANEFTNAEAAVKAVSAGCDMLLCVSNISSVVSAITDAVENGTITESSIDESVTRILAAKIRYGIITG